MLESLYADHLRVQRQHTDAALSACGYDSFAIFAGTPPMQFLDDQPYPFKPNPHFKLWVPLAAPVGCWLLYRPEKKLQLLFLQPVDFWHKPPVTPDDYWTSQFEIVTVRKPEEGLAHLEGFVSDRCAFIGEWDAQFEACGFTARNPQALLAHLHYGRAIKTEYEVECLRRASQLGAQGHRAAASAFRAGESEYGIHLAYLRACEHTDEQLPYPSIVALNANAAVLHYQHLERKPPTSRRSFLIDAGAQFAGYGCDITRTYSHAHDEFATLIERMDALQQQLCARVRPGVDYVDIHLDAHRLIAALLQETGIISVAPDEAVESGLSNVFFPHGVGHLLGLQVHDVAGYALDESGQERAAPTGHPFLRLTRTLEPGFVVTIEPGLYFIEPLLEQAMTSVHKDHINWQTVERFKPYGGIRIEDDVLCTADEPENLTRTAFAVVDAPAHSR